MFPNYRFFVLVLFVFSLTFLQGCGSGGPKVQYVEGIVTLDGTPVEGVNVSFVPKQTPASDDLTGPLLAGGVTDSDGKYKLSTTRGSAVGGGTTVGEYKVTFSKKKMVNAPGGPYQRMAGPPQFEYGVPQAFEDSNKSSISVEVAKGRNKFNFALKSDGTCEVTKKN